MRLGVYRIKSNSDTPCSIGSNTVEYCIILYHNHDYLAWLCGNKNDNDAVIHNIYNSYGDHDTTSMWPITASIEYSIEDIIHPSIDNISIEWMCEFDEDFINLLRLENL